MNHISDFKRVLNTRKIVFIQTAEALYRVERHDDGILYVYDDKNILNEKTLLVNNVWSDYRANELTVLVGSEI